MCANEHITKFVNCFKRISLNIVLFMKHLHIIVGNITENHIMLMHTHHSRNIRKSLCYANNKYFEDLINLNSYSFKTQFHRMVQI